MARRWMLLLLVIASLALPGCLGRRPDAAPPTTSVPQPGSPTGSGNQQGDGLTAGSGGGAGAGPCAVAEPAPVEGTRKVLLYFTCGEEERPVTRLVPEGAEPLQATLAELLKGPTETERKAGLTSWFGPSTAGMLQKATITDQGRAVVDFADFSRVIPNASTSAGSTALIGELKGTVLGIPGVREAEFRFEGDCERFWNWLQRGCEIVK